jgi:hypothetical protein
MIEAAKEKTKKISHRAVYAYAIATVLLLCVGYAGVKSGHRHAAIQVSGWSIGGGTEEHAAREQQLAALSAALPSSAVAPPPAAAPVGPLPARKPVVR